MTYKNLLEKMKSEIDIYDLPYSDTILKPDPETRTPRVTMESVAHYYFESILDIVLEDTEDDTAKLIDPWEDGLHEWADGEVDIYNHDLFTKAWDFKEPTEKAIEEYGADSRKPIDLTKILMQGQYYAYSEFAHAVGNEIEQLLNN